MNIFHLNFHSPQMKCSIKAVQTLLGIFLSRVALDFCVQFHILTVHAGTCSKQNCLCALKWLKRALLIAMLRKGGKGRYSPLEAQTRRTQRQWVRFRWWPRFCLVKLRITSVASAFCTLIPNFRSVKCKAESKLLVKTKYLQKYW